MRVLLVWATCLSAISMRRTKYEYFRRGSSNINFKLKPKKSCVLEIVKLHSSFGGMSVSAHTSPPNQMRWKLCIYVLMLIHVNPLNIKTYRYYNWNVSINYVLFSRICVFFVVVSRFEAALNSIFTQQKICQHFWF